MSAETIARALGGRRSGDNWTASCPAHEDRDPSLSISDADDGKVLVHCHAGCDQALVIDELRSRNLWVESSEAYRRQTKQCAQKTSKVVPTQESSERTAVALRIWHSALATLGTQTEVYLRSRGIQIAVPSSIRFHPHFRHPSGSVWPGMVALVTRATDDVPLAVHRTFLSGDGFDKAPVTPKKMMLGPTRGGIVKLADVESLVMVGEGIETCLSAMQAIKLPAWAALSTSGMRALELPHYILEVIVLADGDEPGEAAAQDCARRWKQQGRRVRIARPPRGMDFNDMLMDRASHIEERAQ